MPPAAGSNTLQLPLSSLQNCQSRYRQPGSHNPSRAQATHTKSPSCKTSARSPPPCFSRGLRSTSRVGARPLMHRWQRPCRRCHKVRRRKQPLRWLPPWPCSHLRSQIRSQEWQVWHKPGVGFPPPPSTKTWAIFSLPRHVAACLFRMKLAASWMPPGPLELAPPRTEALPTVRRGNRDSRAHSTPLLCPSTHQRVLSRGPGPQVYLVFSSGAL